MQSISECLACNAFMICSVQLQ
uniref:Uncharacterized protein n=1 Tax=Arundo donax TaxID=35708 RepID=A0A0A8ZFY9_ARUDO